MLVILSFFD